MQREKGASVYITGSELDALGNAAGLLSALLEASDNKGPELPEALHAVYSVLEKAGKSIRRDTKRAANRSLISKALRVADEILAESP